MKTSTIVCLALSTNFLVSCGYKKKQRSYTRFFSVTKNDKEKWLNYILKLETFRTIINQTQ